MINDPSGKSNQNQKGKGDSEKSAKSGKNGGKYLTFFLGKEEYGLQILKVVEINGLTDVTPIPGTPDFILGIINLRGKIIPIMDLRLKFKMKAVEATDETVTIVVQAQGLEMGIVVDKVSEVVDISSDDIEDTPSLGTDVNTEYILGIGKTDNKVKLLLDIDKVLTSKELMEISNAVSKTEPEPVRA